jgi:predicted membrane GTPase involved in stress response
MPAKEFKMLVANLDYSDYIGRIALGKIYSGKVKVGDPAPACTATAQKEGQNHRHFSF